MLYVYSPIGYILLLEAPRVARELLLRQAHGIQRPEALRPGRGARGRARLQPGHGPGQRCSSHCFSIGIEEEWHEKG